MAPADSALRTYLAALTEVVRARLGPDLVGVYVGGSVALDAYQPGRSDVDVAVVTARPPTAATRPRLVDLLRHEALPCPARGLELVVYRRDAVASATAEPAFDLELNTGAGMPFHAASGAADRNPDGGTFWYALDRSILAEHGLPLTGPPPGEVFGRLDDRALAALLAASVRWHLDAGADESSPAVARTDDAVLNACRALCRIRTGVWTSKPAAGRWALASGVHPVARDIGAREVVERALAARTGGPPPDTADTRRLQRAVLAALTPPTGAADTGAARPRPGV